MYGLFWIRKVVFYELVSPKYKKNIFSALRPESANFPAAARNEVAAFRRRRAEK